VRSGSKVRWEMVESPAYSLREAKYPPSEDAGARLQVNVDATPSDKGVLLIARVSDAGAETARFTAQFPPGSRLERDERGRLNLIADLPWTSDGMLGGRRDEEGVIQSLDELFVFVRQ